MKTNRVLIIVVCLLAALLAFLALSGRIRLGGEAAQERWLTNNVEHTNTVELWRTNFVDRWRTNAMEGAPIVITNEVIKEVPAKLSAPMRLAAIAGYKYLNAPSVGEGAGAFYKASPIAVEVVVEPGATRIVTEGSSAISDRIKADLTSRGVQVADQSPYHLKVDLTLPWSADFPGVALLNVRLELGENAALQRQGDVVGSGAIVWSTTSSRLVRTAYAAEEVKAVVQDSLDKFCNEYLQEKEKQKAMEARMPAVPPELLEEGK